MLKNLKNLIFVVFCITAFLLLQGCVSKTAIKHCTDLSGYDRAKCITNEAILNSDPSICKEINEKRWRIACYSDIAVEMQNAELCKGSELDIDWCLFRIMLSEKNFSCESLSTQYWSDICYGKAALTHLDSNFCKYIKHSEAMDDCFYTLALNSSSLEDCIAIGSHVKRKQCYTKLAQILHNASICERLVFEQDAVSRDVCIKKVALLLANQSLCSKIKIPQIRSACIEKLGK